MPPEGSYDLIQYWSAYHLLVAGQNPFDPQATLALQCGQGLHCEFPRITYTPPWLWLLLAPILRQDFATTAVVWERVSWGLALTCGLAIGWAYRLAPLVLWTPAAVIALSLPMLTTLSLGQISPVLLLGAALLLAGTRRERPAWQAAGLFLFSAKPHLFLPTVVVFTWMTWRRPWPEWLPALAVMTAVGLTASEWLHDGATREWLRHLLLPQTAAGVRAAAAWQTASPATDAIHWLDQLRFPYPRLAMIALPAASTVAALSWFSRRGGRAWPRDLPALVALGVASAPFAWFSDFLVALVAPAALIANAVAAARWQLALSAAVTVVAYSIACAFRYQQLGFRDQELSWFPVGLLVVWLVGRSQLRTQ